MSTGIRIKIEKKLFVWEIKNIPTINMVAGTSDKLLKLSIYNGPVKYYNNPCNIQWRIVVFTMLIVPKHVHCKCYKKFV